MSFNSRGTGKTTARVLQSIADALLHPDQPVAVVPDDFSMNDSGQIRIHLERFAESIIGKCKCLGITLIVEVADHAVLLMSPITRMREEHHRKCDPTSCDTDEKSSALRDAELAVSIAECEVKSAAESLAKALRDIVLPEGCTSDQIKKDAEFVLDAAIESMKNSANSTQSSFRSQQPFVTTIDVSLAESSFRSDSFLDGFGRPVRKNAAEGLAESLRKAFPGRVLPKGTEIVQQQPTSEASKQAASIPDAQSDSDKHFIHELNSNRTMREMCNVVESHMAKELGFQNLGEYRDAVRAAITNHKTPPEQPQAPPQDKIPEVSFSQEFMLMPQRWPEALMKWNMEKQRHESKPYSITCNGVDWFEARVVKYPKCAQLQWMRQLENSELAVLGIVFHFK